MAKQINNTFTSYELTEDEHRSGAILSELNICMLRNLLSMAAQEKLNLAFDTTNPTKYAQEEAALQGKLVILYLLLDSHEAAISSLPQT